MVGLNRFGRRMAILYAVMSVPMAVLVQWNSKLSDTQLRNGLLAIVVVFEALAAEIKQRRKESHSE
jgi:hypothetical protein